MGASSRKLQWEYDLITTELYFGKSDGDTVISLSNHGRAFSTGIISIFNPICYKRVKVQRAWTTHQLNRWTRTESIKVSRVWS